jgi:hypothetical protein
MFIESRLHRHVVRFRCDWTRGPRWTVENRPLIDGSKPATTSGRPRPDSVLSHAFPWWQIAVELRTPAAWTTLQHVRVVEQAIEQRSDRCGVAEQLAPVVHRAV